MKKTIWAALVVSSRRIPTRHTPLLHPLPHQLDRSLSCSLQHILSCALAFWTQAPEGYSRTVLRVRLVTSRRRLAGVFSSSGHTKNLFGCDYPWMIVIIIREWMIAMSSMLGIGWYIVHLTHHEYLHGTKLNVQNDLDHTHKFRQVLQLIREKNCLYLLQLVVSLALSQLTTYRHPLLSKIFIN